MVEVMMTRLLFIISLLIGGLIFLGCGSAEPPEESDTEVQLPLPDQVLTNSETYLTKAGRRTGVIKSETLKVYQNRDTTLMYVVEVDFYDSLGTHILTLTADSAKVTKAATVLEAVGHVHAWTDDGKSLDTDSLRWDAESGKVTTEGYVEAISGGTKVSGWGMETDQRLENVIIKRDSEGSFEEPGTDDH